MKFRTLYAAKPNGEGWSSDSEMLACKEEGLVYFATIDELRVSGLNSFGETVCVAVLIEGRNSTGSSIGLRSITVGFEVNVKSSAEIGKVYQTTNVVRVWMKANEIGEEYTRLDKNLETSDYPPYREITSSYTKSSYDSEGNMLPGSHTPGYRGGQSVLIVGAQVNIEKSIAQKSGIGTKTTYDIDAGQWRVDYVLSPSLRSNTATDGKDGNSEGMLGEVTVVDILPYGLYYMKESGVLGGTYETDDTIHGGSVSGGTPMEPVITLITDTEGNTVERLEWKFLDVQVDEEMEKIHFSVIIGNPEEITNDISNGQSFLNTVRIHSNLDGRAVNTVNRNIATAGHNIIKLGSTKLIKSVAKQMHEVGEDIVYTVSYNNSGTIALTNMKVLDILPYLQDGRGTNYHGRYWVESIEVDTSRLSAASTIDVVYTTDTEVRTKTAQEVELSSWETANIGEVEADATIYEISHAESPITPTAIAVKGTLAGQDTVTFKVTLKVIDNEPGNIYGNHASGFGDNIPNDIIAPIVQARVAKRTLQGVTWRDANRNGQRELTERFLSGVKVTLLDSTGVPAKDVLGNPIASVETDMKGAYRFENLPAGAYQVLFESSDYVDLGIYQLSPKNAPGVATSVNSDAEVNTITSEGKLESAIIHGIVLPKLEDMTLHDYILGYQDAGFYSDLEFRKLSEPAGGATTETAALVKEGQVIRYNIEVEVQTAISNIRITDRVPEGLSIVPGSITYQVSTGQLTQVNNGAYDKESRVISWPELHLPVGVSVVSFQAVVDKLPDGVEERVFANVALMSERVQIGTNRVSTK